MNRPSVDRRWLGQLVTTIVLAVGVAHVVAGDDGPRLVVQQTADQVVDVLSDKSLALDAKRHRVEHIVYAHFDFDTLSRLVLARNWSQLSPTQQQEFVDAFKTHLSMTYGRNVETYRGERAVVVGDRAENGGDWTVKTKIERPNAADVSVDYRLRRHDGQWMVIDVIIEGVSLVANYRSQFHETIENGGPDKLVSLLRDRNARHEPLRTR